MAKGKGNLGNLAPPFTKKSASSDDDAPSSSKPSFTKKKKGKPFGKVAPAQKSMMRSGRSFGRGR